LRAAVPPWAGAAGRGLGVAPEAGVAQDLLAGGGLGLRLRRRHGKAAGAGKLPAASPGSPGLTACRIRTNAFVPRGRYPDQFMGSSASSGLRALRGFV